MAVTDDIKTVEDRLWALLLASADFTSLVKVANRVKMNDPARQVSPRFKSVKQVADFPEVEIDRGRSRRVPFRNSVTFGTFGAGPCPRIEDKSQDFVITIVVDDQGDVAAGQVQQATEDAIVAGGPQLGLASAVRLVEELAGTHELTSRGKAKGVMRRVVTVTVRIGLRKAA